VISRLVLSVVTFCILLAVCPTGAGAQTTNQLWTDYSAHFYLKPKFEFFGDAGYRFDEHRVWKMAYVRPSLRYHSYGYEVHGGLGVFYTYNEFSSNVLELRPWQGFLTRWPRFSRSAVTHWFRAEERFQLTLDDGSWSAQLRLRYKIASSIPFSENRWGGHLLIPFSIEVFGDMGELSEVFASQLRFDVGVGYVFNREWVAEVHTILQRSSSGSSDKLNTNDLIIRIQVKRLVTTWDYGSQNL